MYWYIKALKNYATFRGRATRTEYWMFTLFAYIFTLVLYTLVFIDSIALLGSIFNNAIFNNALWSSNDSAFTCSYCSPTA
ncbi:DUF805 domain-containing protein [Priestia megaterium]|uniref:DUF805 domain-containing protein n=1 Tax=Priestia megaterium TaxID=1404 RepID=UPI002DDA9244|nr:DUF805 domain-containing protein [Priestia megaterium]